MTDEDEDGVLGDALIDGRPLLRGWFLVHSCSSFISSVDDDGEDVLDILEVGGLE